METTFMDKCAIISEFSNSFLVNDERFEKINNFNKDIVYPLATLVTNGYVVALDDAVNSIDQAWKDFLGVFGTEDSGFELMYEVLLSAGGDWLQYV